MSTTQTSVTEEFAIRSDAHRPIARRKRTTPCTRRNSASFRRHARKCAVCKHKERVEIELDFLHWHSASGIAHHYGLPSWAVYRHAHATGLFKERMLNIRYAAVHIAEQAESVKPSAMAVIHAIRACSLINDQGQWIDPPKRLIVERRNLTEEGRAATAGAVEAPRGQATAPASSPGPAPAASTTQAHTRLSAQPLALTPSAAAQSSNRNFHLLENGATPTKQTTEGSSNRNSYDKNPAPTGEECAVE
jgi:hypothetical protein